VFDAEKLAWVNRHYLKVSPSLRIAELSLPYFNAAGFEMQPNAAGLAFLTSAMPIATGSVDRLEQVPARLAFLFDYDAHAALADERVREEMRGPDAQAVVRSLAEKLRAAPRLDRERFRGIANDVKNETGQKGRALFHPIRVALMGQPEGPELDLAVPTIDRGADLPADAGVPRIVGCRERAAAMVHALDLAIAH
jgi:glutamyl-tRNA synthetase/nondiscriminating glutamyl-tRNA synthetase